MPSQVVRLRKGIRIHWIVDGLRPDSSRKYKVTATPGVKRKKSVQLKEETGPDRVDVWVRGSHIMSYHHDSQWVRPYWNPIRGPQGVSVTRNWPMDPEATNESTDQPHQKSMWIGYGECGTVDNWTELPGHGYQRHIALGPMVSGSVFGRMVARTAWCTAKGRTQFEDTRDMRVYAISGTQRMMDVAVSIRCTKSDVTLKDTKEGGLLSVRVATEMEGRQSGKIQNTWGAIGQEEAWGQRAPWCDYSGEVDGTDAGIAMMEHPGNPRYPTYWHVRDYGLMAANCFGWSHFKRESRRRGDMKLKKGSTTTWRYRVWIHRGDAQRGRVADRFCDFAAPPKITHNAA